MLMEISNLTFLKFLFEKQRSPPIWPSEALVKAIFNVTTIKSESVQEFIIMTTFTE